MSRPTRRAAPPRRPALAPLALALALLLPAPPSGAAPALGRLFASPAERAELDARRSAAPAGVLADGPAAPAEPAPPGPPDGAAAGPAPLVLNGVLRRSNGQSTVWLNQAPQNDGANDLRRGAGLTVRLPSGKRVLLRAGQRYDPADGKVKEVHEP